MKMMIHCPACHARLTVSQKADPGHLVDFSWVMLVLSDSQIAETAPAEEPGPLSLSGDGSSGARELA